MGIIPMNDELYMVKAIRLLEEAVNNGNEPLMVF